MATEALVQCVVAELCSIAKDGLSSLFGVKKEVDELSSTFLDIQAVLEDAESHQVTDERVRGWLWELKEVAYEVDDILDEWVTDALVLQEDKDEAHHPKRMRFSSFSPYQSYKRVKLQYDIGKRIRETTKRLSEISIKKNRFNLRELNTREVMLVPNQEERQTGSLIDESEIFGRDDFKQSIIEQLLSETSQEEKSVSVVSIVGMGGLGKTTLAQLIYNDGRVMAHFRNNRIWVCVSDPFDVKRIAVKVIESMGGSTSNNPDLDTLQHSLREAIDKKRFLLVLDDVWDESGRLWQILRVPLLGAAPGSKIVVTTRSGQVGKAMEAHYIHDLGVLSDSDCWNLFKSIAFKGAEDEECQQLTDIGEKIVERCKGVPLAIRALGSLLHANRKRWYWEHVLESEIWKWDVPKDNGILPALLLSYYNLPPHLKRCFSFCSVFPKDYELEKDELVKLWMAHGIIKSEKAKKDVTEEIGEMYFDYLLTRSLFQDAEKDIDGNVVRFKMHDLVHDLATFVSSGDYSSMEAGVSELCSIKCHHLSLLVNDNVSNDDVSSVPSLLCNVERLHTLLLLGDSNIEVVLDTLFNPLRYLRALGLSGTYIENLPSFIGKLKYLRYLKLDRRGITELPESITSLCNLQTLKLNYCTDLHTLPSGISKMVKLRHLEVKGTNNLTVLPNGLGRLTSLRTLCKFPVGDENRGCKIGELRDLNLLRGELSIENLERVMNVNDASEAELHKKSDLYVLSLCCNDKSDEEWRTLGDDEIKRMDSVLEGLRPPHSNLKELKIKNYAGSMFPSWLEDSRFSSLVKVVLKNCSKCMLLPGLGKLHSLKYLEIIRANEVKVVGGDQFYGNVKDVWGKKTRFPKLEELYFKSMLNWEEWKLEQEYGELMPSLKQLRIFNCKKLKATPNYLPSTLREVTIFDCNEVIWAQDNPLPHLLHLRLEHVRGMSSKPLPYLPALLTLEINGFSCESLPSDGWGMLESLHTLRISDCPELISLPEGLGQLKALQTLMIWTSKRLSSLPEGLVQLKALQELNIWNCERLSSLPQGLGQLKALHTLKIFGCKRLSSLPEGLGQLKALQTLHIENCERLSSLPEGLGQLEALQTLHIKNCERLSSLPEGLGQLKALQTLQFWDCDRLSSLPEGLGQLEALQTLQFWNCDQMSSLPEGLGQLEALQTLQIWGCERLSSMFDGFDQLKSLCRLDFWDCPELRPLPNLQRLTALQRLSIHRCPLLTERLEKDKGEDWCKISHIPRIDIDDGVNHDREHAYYMLCRSFRKKK
ncbi:putative disease resistance protein RGA3 isoform X1 [Cinnamomum micranthum f. kanehirae]|uniref:Putative disease resistance protein RGA3 isoform X1 n=1 Tax=Cinnamomum micranthum f. kanehirae TaxID=337451 RepID=A0A443N8W3_9MAGN|nr:putative disease resistance protein RGA3 isoform X1 [Cinnamomum micranthum f. kanehirae]